MAAGLVSALVVGGLVVWATRRPAPAPITRTSIVLPSNQQSTTQGRRVAISASGSHIVYVANSQLYLRPLDELRAQPLAGTEGSDPRSPFFSPDGAWVAFFSGQDGRLKKVPLSGGTAVTITDAPDGTGGSWGEDDTIVFSETRRAGTTRVVGSSIRRVAGTGGTPETLVTPDPGSHPRQPQLLPGGEALLYTLSPSYNLWADAQVVVERLSTGERTVVVDRGGDARYLSTGHLIYGLDGALVAAPFDLGRLEVTGGAVSLLDNVSLSRATGALDADVAQTGVGATDISQTLAFVLTREIDWSALPEQTPPSVRLMLRRCLTRERKDRLTRWAMDRVLLTRGGRAQESCGFRRWSSDSHCGQRPEGGQLGGRRHDRLR